MFESTSSNFSQSRMQQTLMLLTSDVPFYDLPCLNVKILDKPLRRWILDKDSGPIYGNVKQNLIDIAKNQNTEFYKKRKIIMRHKETLWHS